MAAQLRLRSPRRYLPWLTVAVAMKRAMHNVRSRIKGLWSRGADALDPVFVEDWQAADDDAARRRVVIDQVANALCAASMARRVSAPPDQAMVPRCPPVAGSSTGAVREMAESIRIARSTAYTM